MYTYWVLPKHWFTVGIFVPLCALVLESSDAPGGRHPASPWSTFKGSPFVAKCPYQPAMLAP